MNDIFFDTIFPIFISIAMILWIYCIWFLNKYDRNTNRLILLLILNIYYIPFYLFRIKQIKKENRIKAISEDIYDSEFIEMSRSSIIETLELWTSKERQQNYKKSENDLNLSEELFQQWKNNYQIDNKIIEEAFNDMEKQLLKTFDKAIQTSYKKNKDGFPILDELQSTNDWKVLNKLAIEITKELK